MPNFIDLTGSLIGRWTVLGRAADRIHGRPQFLCQCDCGAQKVVPAQALRTGKSQSCGCRNLEIRKRICVERNTTHGMTRTRTYVSWMNMIQRCTNPNNHKYKNYGARGIRVFDAWRDFNNFLSDMGKCPSKRHSLDRINSDGDYCPGNCRWVTMKVQQNNRTNNRRLTFNGQTLTLMEWSERYGINCATLKHRLRRGWNMEKALTEPAVKGRNQYS